MLYYLALAVLFFSMGGMLALAEAWIFGEIPDEDEE
jgi:hypothetical protein